jgi:hypothetical protein
MARPHVGDGCIGSGGACAGKPGANLSSAKLGLSLGQRDMRVVAYPAAKASEVEAEARLELYADALDDIPADVLGAACASVLRTSKFFPAPSEIRERCAGLARRQWELSKIRALVATHDRNWRPEPEPLSDEDRAAVAAIVGRVGVTPDQRDAA